MSHSHWQEHGKHWFVTRHLGAIEWMARQGYRVDEHVAHLDIERVHAGDVVYGTLPIHLVAQVCARGGRYYHLALELTAQARGCELSADQLDGFAARFVAYHCQVLGTSCK